MDRLVTGRRKHHVEQAAILRIDSEDRRTAINLGAKHWRGGVEVPGHARMLAALSGEHEDDVGRAGERRAAAMQSRMALVLRKRLKRRSRLLRISGHDRGALDHVATADASRMSDVGDAAGVLPKSEAQIAGNPPQRLLALSRDGNHMLRPVGCRSQCRLCRSLLDDDVGICAAEAEGTDTRATGRAPHRPGTSFGHHLDRDLVPRNVGVGLGKVEALGQSTRPKSEDRFHNPGDSGCRLQVADVGLGRSDEQRRAPTRAIGGGERFYFDRVAKRGASAVRLDIVDISGLQAGVG